MANDAVSLAEVSAELYGLDPEAFTAARNARAKEAAAGGDRALATAIKKLGKPTAAAWLANRLARSRASTVDELIDLGPELRRTQSSGQRGEMRQLVEQRRALIGDLVRSASKAAREGGHSFGSSVERQLEEILEAAVADETLGVALREGRLTEPFRFVGFGESSESDPGPNVKAAGRATTKKTSGASRADSARADSARADTARADTARESEAERRAAREALAEIEESVEKARSRLEAAEERLQRAAKLMGEAEAEKAASTDALRAARQALGPARRRLTKLGGP